MEKKGYVEEVAAKLIEQLKAGTAPWQKPWAAGVPNSFAPTNPVTGKRYRGANSIRLMCENRDDSRWMTYKQAQESGWQVKKGEKGTRIEYWKTSETRQRLDAVGKPVLDDEGKAVVDEVSYERPRVFRATVFNGSQIEGIPVEKVEGKTQTWDPSPIAERILAASGASISHDQHDRAFYRPGDDTIHLPGRNRFEEASAYYAVALHELGHWTGHESRLHRDLSHPFGSQGYGREELRAEIASLMLGDELGIGHDPGQHAAYVDSWIEVLRKDPCEIFRAAAAAEKIRDFVVELELEREREKGVVMEAERQQEAGMARKLDERAEKQSLSTPSERVWLQVKYEDRLSAKSAGAKWDREEKRWYAGPDADMKILERFLTENVPVQGLAITPREEFAATLESIGAIVDGEHPVMDGKPHRIRCEGDKQGERAGFYVGFLDGRPNGYCKNNRTGTELRWKATGHRLAPEQKIALQAQAERRRIDRAKETEERYELAAERIERQIKGLSKPERKTPYMEKKGIAITDGVLTEASGKETCVPGHDAEGKVWTMEYIQEDGRKRFAKGSRKEGCFHPIAGMADLAAADVLVVCEGYATGVSLEECLRAEASVVSAFDSGNLIHVAKALRERFPDKMIVIAGDDDRRLERTKGVNPGRIHAEQAAEAVGGRAVFPVFAPGEEDLTDWNDLANGSALGKDGVKRQINFAVMGALVERKAAMEQQQQERRQDPMRGRGWSR